jgi:lipid II:glycine glycyltransferase (peptidoglycan interpeptide bridge formation enzyme)
VIEVSTISAEQHRAYVDRLAAAGGAASFLQTPGWAAVKPEWRAESLGWFSEGELVGAALVLYRRLPRLKRSLAYLPEGPLLDWDAATGDLAAWLEPLTAHVKRQGGFGVRIGPPVVTRRWSAAQVKEGIADEAVTSLTSLPPTTSEPTGLRVVEQLQALGWRAQSVAGGFAAGQPQYNFQVPLARPDGTPCDEDELLRGMNQQWRRNIKKAAKAGVEVTVLSPERESPELKAFHDLYVHTAERDHFTPRGLAYFSTMAASLNGDQPDRLRLYLAHHEGDLVAATLWIRVGAHAWYSYGASSSEKRDVRGSNAVQWQMIRDALAAGARVYDLRGITDTLRSDDSHVGLVQFKVGTGGEAVEYAGEWDLPLSRPLYAAFQLYLRRRG